MAAEDTWPACPWGAIEPITYVTINGAFNVGGVAGNAKSILRLTPNGKGWTGRASTGWPPARPSRRTSTACRCEFTRIRRR
ncbi:MAG: hypothetical protein IPH95_16110 [Candidatus Promineofilum sp.]|nr:hypothetical protein [Promineifilum sp.]